MPFPANSTNGQSLISRLNTRVRSNDVWMQLFTAVSRVIDERVARPRSQLATIRSPYVYNRGDWISVPTENGESQRAIVNSIRAGGGPNGSDMVYAQIAGSNVGIEFAIPSNFKEKSIQIAGCRLHGFNYFADTLSQEDYGRIHEWVEQYWPVSGTKQFAKFIGFIKNMKLDVHQLWSDEVSRDQDYYPYLERSPRSLPVYLGGASYPTSHVELAYDPVLEHQDIDIADLFFLFYYLAPIHLVLHRIVADVTTPPIIVRKALAIAPIKLFTYARLDLAPHSAKTFKVKFDPLVTAASAKAKAIGSTAFTTDAATLAATNFMRGRAMSLTPAPATVVSSAKAISVASLALTFQSAALSSSAARYYAPATPLASWPLGGGRTLA